MMNNYILDGHTPVKEPDMLKWGEWMQKNDRHVRKTTGTVKLHSKKMGEVTISTVFLGLDHNFSGSGDPILFETMVFSGLLNGQMDRCSSWEAAEKMHELMCQRVKLAYAEAWKEETYEALRTDSA